MSGEKKVFKFVDISKFLFAILTVLMHLNMFEQLPYGQYLKAATSRLSVSFFFVATGFFFSRSLYDNGVLSWDKEAVYSKRNKFIRRLAIMLAIMEPINLALRVIEYLLENVSAKEIVIRVVRSVVFYPVGALWYLQACIVAALIIVPFIVRRKDELLIIPALIFYAVLLLCNRYYFLIEGTVPGNLAKTVTAAISSMRNGLTVGLPFMLAGVLIAKHWAKLLRHVKTIRAITVIAWLMLIAEAVLTEHRSGIDDRGRFVMLIPLIPALFFTTATVSRELKTDTLTIRNLSTSIYLIHSPIISLITVFQLIIFHSSDGGVVKAALVMILTAAFIALIYRNKNSKAFHYLT